MKIIHENIWKLNNAENSREHMLTSTHINVFVFLLWRQNQHDSTEHQVPNYTMSPESNFNKIIILFRP